MPLILPNILISLLINLPLKPSAGVAYAEKFNLNSLVVLSQKSLICLIISYPNFLEFSSSP